MNTTDSGFADYLQGEYPPWRRPATGSWPPRCARLGFRRLRRQSARGLWCNHRDDPRRRAAGVHHHPQLVGARQPVPMGEAALAASPVITEITQSIPNVHYLPLDVSLRTRRGWESVPAHRRAQQPNRSHPAQAMMGALTTHVLDTAHDKPSAGIRLELLAAGPERRLVTAARTNPDRRCDAPLPRGGSFSPAHGSWCFTWASTSPPPVWRRPTLRSWIGSQCGSGSRATPTTTCSY